MFPGSLYITGVISPYIKSYYRLPEENNMTLNIMPMCQVLGACIMPIGSYLAQYWNPKLMILLGEAVALSALMAAALMSSSFGWFVTFYVIAYGTQNFVYMVPIHHVWQWYPGHPGLMSGILIGGYGLGAFLFDNVATHVINPDNLGIDETTGYYPAAVTDRFQRLMFVLIGSFACITVIGIVCVFGGPKFTEDRAKERAARAGADGAFQLLHQNAEDMQDGQPTVEDRSSVLSSSQMGLRDQLINGSSDGSVLTTNSFSSPAMKHVISTSAQPAAKATIKEMVMTRQFVTLYLMNVCSVMSGFFVINNFKSYD